LGLPGVGSAPECFGEPAGDTVLYWTEPNFGLQEADDVLGPWRNAIGTNSPVAVRAAAVTDFSRLRRLKRLRSGTECAFSKGRHFCLAARAI
jgi:hypothetical protein